MNRSIRKAQRAARATACGRWPNFVMAGKGLGVGLVVSGRFVKDAVLMRIFFRLNPNSRLTGFSTDFVEPKVRV